MNTLTKITLAALILGAGSQQINAYPWSPKAIAAVTLAGLGLGAAGAGKYYGFNTITTAVLEKCANAKNWFTNKLSDAVYGSYKKQIQQLRDERTRLLEEKIEEEAILKEVIKEALTDKDKALEAKEADRKDAHERAINLTQRIIAQNKTLIELKTEKNRVEELMRGTISGLNNRSVRHEADKKAAQSEVERLQAVLAAYEQRIAALTPVAELSDEGTNESSEANSDSGFVEINS